MYFYDFGMLMITSGVLTLAFIGDAVALATATGVPEPFRPRHDPNVELAYYLWTWAIESLMHPVALLLLLYRYWRQVDYGYVGNPSYRESARGHSDQCPLGCGSRLGSLSADVRLS